MKLKKVSILSPARKFIHHSLTNLSCRRYLSDSPPLTGCCAGTPQLFGEQVGRCRLHQLFQHLLHDTQRPISSRNIQTESRCLQSWPNVAVVQFARTRYRRDRLLLQ